LVGDFVDKATKFTFLDGTTWERNRESNDPKPADDTSPEGAKIVNPASNVINIRFQEDGYIDGGMGNDWHYVWLTNPSCDGVNYMWNNKAGVSWSLTAVMDGDKIASFDVGEDCPYYNAGHTNAKLTYDGEAISSIAGPWDEPYDAHLEFTTDFVMSPEPSVCPA